MRIGAEKGDVVLKPIAPRQTPGEDKKLDVRAIHTLLSSSNNARVKNATKKTIDKDVSDIKPIQPALRLASKPVSG